MKTSRKKILCTFLAILLIAGNLGFSFSAQAAAPLPSTQANDLHTKLSAIPKSELKSFTYTIDENANGTVNLTITDLTTTGTIFDAADAFAKLLQSVAVFGDKNAPSDDRNITWWIRIYEALNADGRFGPYMELIRMFTLTRPFNPGSTPRNKYTYDKDGYGRSGRDIPVNGYDFSITVIRKDIQAIRTNPNNYFAFAQPLSNIPVKLTYGFDGAVTSKSVLTGSFNYFSSAMTKNIVESGDVNNIIKGFDDYFFNSGRINPQPQMGQPDFWDCSGMSLNELNSEIQNSQKYFNDAKKALVNYGFLESDLDLFFENRLDLVENYWEMLTNLMFDLYGEEPSTEEPETEEQTTEEPTTEEQTTAESTTESQGIVQILINFLKSIIDFIKNLFKVN